MEIDKLKTFVDLAETRNFSQTAVNLFIGQSSVSKHIKSLEKEINHPLFIRNNKKTSLSRYGKAMYPYARQIIKIQDELNQELTKLDEEEKTTITIGVIPTFAKYSAFKQITTYMQDHLEIAINLREMETDQLWEQLEKGKIDVAFMRIFNKVSQGYDSIFTQKESFNLWVSRHNSLATKDKVKLSELKDYNFISLAQNSLLRQPMIELCQKENFTPNIIFSSYRMSSIEEMIADDQGIAIEMGEPQLRSKVKTIKIIPTQECSLVFLRKKEGDKTNTNGFWKYLKKCNSILE